MKTRTIESLVFVAIVTSAGVMQIREHLLPVAHATSASSTATTCAQQPAGVIPASCVSLRDSRTPHDEAQDRTRNDADEPADRATTITHRAQIWV
ncbi:hypothetical protein [Paraburkholderia flava]|uniref:hypothetical protein n=1 Tax=Paraburkholderia flava TaxID=2547393 RepID=UPI00105B91DC|nr:hypothetical protein [Paraburkholderia flava]